ncbi:unnamed protein product [Paramecium sonneborni]|uniref:Pyridine nucleotide-disulphide oxidoreductase N-terminal domain-containing protein n=1 Tax=Paramecium sonneborni TaxID=65129 RepID=A0A8S1R7Q9_9CILI|nr:unnamed protein product [Paramecium sonneborni]
MYQINFQRIITRVVGGGYIALECAGILKGLCFDVTLMTRGKQLREFDQDIVEMILEHYQKYQKANIIPQSLTFHSEQKILFKWLSTVSSQKGSGIIDTLLMVIGNTKLLNLDELGVKVNHKMIILQLFLLQLNIASLAQIKNKLRQNSEKKH